LGCHIGFVSWKKTEKNKQNKKKNLGKTRKKIRKRQENTQDEGSERNSRGFGAIPGFPGSVTWDSLPALPKSRENALDLHWLWAGGIGVDDQFLSRG
jgi:hypothetical protein